MRLAALAFLLALAGLIGLADLGRLPAPILAVYRYPGGDLLGHFALAAVGAILLERSATRLPPGAAALAFALALTAEELSQVWNVHRVCDPADLAATWVGVAVGLGWAARSARQRRPEAAGARGCGPRRISPR